MIKKLAVLTTVLLMLCSGIVFAGVDEEDADIIMPYDVTYDWGRLVEDSQLGLSRDSVERVSQLEEFSWRRLKALEKLEKEDVDEYAEDLVETIENFEENLYEEMEKIQDVDLEAVLENIQKSSENKRERLMALSADENMPEGARNGAENALQNQIRAEENMQNAFEKALQARENREKPETEIERTVKPEIPKPDLPEQRRGAPEEIERVPKPTMPLDNENNSRKPEINTESKESRSSNVERATNNHPGVR